MENQASLALNLCVFRYHLGRSLRKICQGVVEHLWQALDSVAVLLRQESKGMSGSKLYWRIAEQTEISEQHLRYGC